jgi:hypothetical protein
MVQGDIISAVSTLSRRRLIAQARIASTLFVGNSRLTLRTCTICVVLLAISTTGLASAVYVSTDFDLGSDWRTSSVSKNDVDGNDVLGTDGWFVAGGAGSLVLPTYLSSLTTDPSVYSGNGGYASIDDPNTTPGLAPSLLQSGTLNPFPGTGGLNVDMSFTFGANVPGTVRLGLMVDNLDIAAFNPSSLQVVQDGGPGASAVVDTTGLDYNNRIPDWVYFDIQAQPGETYDVVVAGGPNGCACLGAVSFDSADSAVPEPSSFGLVAVGAALLAAAALRRAR